MLAVQVAGFYLLQRRGLFGKIMRAGVRFAGKRDWSRWVSHAQSIDLAVEATYGRAGPMAASFVLSLIALPVLYVFGRRRFDREVGLGAMSLLAVLPVHLIYAGFGIRESLVALTSILAVWTLTIEVEGRGRPARRGGLVWARHGAAPLPASCPRSRSASTSSP